MRLMEVRVAVMRGGGGAKAATKDEDERLKVEKLAMAQKFDIKLEREVKRRAGIMVDVSHKLAG